MSKHLKVKNSVVCAEFPMELNLFFPSGKHIFSQFIVLLIFFQFTKESLGHSVLVGERAWLNCQFSRKRNVHTFITILCQFKWRKKQQNFPGVVSPARHPNCLWDKRNLFANASFCSDRSWYFDECAWRLHCIPFFGQPDFCLIFILSKNNNVFQSGALLKIPPSSLFMEELDLDIQKKMSLEQRLIFPIQKKISLE